MRLFRSYAPVGREKKDSLPQRQAQVRTGTSSEWCDEVGSLVFFFPDLGVGFCSSTNDDTPRCDVFPET